MPLYELLFVRLYEKQTTNITDLYRNNHNVCQAKIKEEQIKGDGCLVVLGLTAL